MVKKIKMKPGKGCQKENRNMSFKQEAQELVERGEVFGDSIIAQLSQIAINPLGMGAATIGLAKAYASLKYVAGRFGVDVESLFNHELPLYDAQFKELLDQELK